MAKPNTNTKMVSFDIRGMHCASCALTIERALSREKGVKAANVSYVGNKASVEYDGKKTDEKRLVERVNKIGYKAFFASSESEGFATDPVCGMRVSRANSIKKQFDGRLHYFCSEECVKKFESPEEELKSISEKIVPALPGLDEPVPASFI